METIRWISGSSGLLVLLIFLIALTIILLLIRHHLDQEIAALKEKYEDERENIEDVVIMLARTVDAKDKYTEGHIERVSQYAVFLGERLGLIEKQLEYLRIGGLIHDIGKIGIDMDILNKPGPLSDEEMSLVRMHPVLGEQICRPLKSLESVRCIIRSHHEKLDGSGYPDGLSGDQICLEARIVAVVDIFDALTTDRSYRQALSVPESVSILREEAQDGKLDGELVKEFVSMLEEMGLNIE